MFQSVENVAEVVFEMRYTGSDRAYNNVAHFLRVSDWDAETIQDLATAANARWAISMAPYCPSTAELTRVTTRDLTTEFGVQGLVDEAVAGTGEDVEWLPPNCAVPVLMRCSGGTAPRHGYAFWPFVLEADCDRVGTLSGDALEVPGAYGVMLVDTATVTTLCTPVIVSRRETIVNPTPPPATISVPRDPTVVSSIASYVIGRDGFVASQRDRRAGPT